MITGDLYTNIVGKKILGTQDFKDYLLDYLKSSSGFMSKKIYTSQGVFSTVALTDSGIDEFDIEADQEAIDGHGRFMKTSSELTSNIKFENASAVVYDIGLRYAEKPKGIQTNPRTGWPEYLYWEETIGERDEPDLVEHQGLGVIKLVVDSVCESGVSHAGRKCYAWMVTPAKNAVTEAKAIEEHDVLWDGSNNYIMTTGDSLGQEISDISETPSQYQVLLVGPTVRRNSSLGNPDHAFLGTVTGGGSGNSPDSFNISGQNLHVASWVDYADIVRDGSQGTLKVAVDAQAGEAVDELQIRVRDSGLTTIFSVDQGGDVFIAGDLTVEGETTQENVVEVLSNHTITGALEAGDADTDQHVFKGVTEYQTQAGVMYAQFDGANSRGVFAGDLLPSTDDSRNLGSGTNRWDNLYVTEINGGSEVRCASILAPTINNGKDLGTTSYKWRHLFIAGNIYGDLIPGADNAQDLGDGSNSWKDLYIKGGVYGEIRPATNNVYDLGTGTHGWKNVYWRGGAGNTIRPTAHDTYDLGVTGTRWKDLYLSGIAYITGDVVASHLRPQTASTYNLGSASEQWNSLYLTGELIGGASCSQHWSPNSHNTRDLGADATRWRTLYLETSLDLDGTLSVEGVSTMGHIYPITSNFNNLGQVDNRWDRLYVNYVGASENPILTLWANSGSSYGIVFPNSHIYEESNVAVWATDADTDTLRLRLGGTYDRGWEITGSGYWGGILQPTANRQQDIGSSSRHARTVYLEDIVFANYGYNSEIHNRLTNINICTAQVHTQSYSGAINGIPYNVASVTRSSAGVYVVNFDDALGNYTAGSPIISGCYENNVGFSYIAKPSSSTSCNVYTFNASNVATDSLFALAYMGGGSLAP